MADTDKQGCLTGQQIEAINKAIRNQERIEIVPVKDGIRVYKVKRSSI